MAFSRDHFEEEFAYIRKLETALLEYAPSLAATKKMIYFN
jgi:hypothetical protein